MFIGIWEWLYALIVVPQTTHGPQSAPPSTALRRGPHSDRQQPPIPPVGPSHIGPGKGLHHLPCAIQQHIYFWSSMAGGRKKYFIWLNHFWGPRVSCRVVCWLRVFFSLRTFFCHPIPSQKHVRKVQIKHEGHFRNLPSRNKVSRTMF